jgi:hypothetical protein
MYIGRDNPTGCRDPDIHVCVDQEKPAAARYLHIYATRNTRQANAIVQHAALEAYFMGCIWVATIPRDVVTQIYTCV